VIHVLDGICEITNDFDSKGINFIAISSNDVKNYPKDDPVLMKKLSIEKKFNFPYLYDESQNIAKAYDAACTPDFYLFDSKKLLVYRGQLDNSRPGNEIPVSGKDLRDAISDLLEGNPINLNQKPSLGCNIKWKN
jgi:hypothetical protein